MIYLYEIDHVVRESFDILLCACGWYADIEERDEADRHVRETPKAMSWGHQPLDPALVDNDGD